MKVGIRIYVSVGGRGLGGGGRSRWCHFWSWFLCGSEWCSSLDDSGRPAQLFNLSQKCRVAHHLASSVITNHRTRVPGCSTPIPITIYFKCSVKYIEIFDKKRKS